MEPLSERFQSTSIDGDVSLPFELDALGSLTSAIAEGV